MKVLQLALVVMFSVAVFTLLSFLLTGGNFEEISSLRIAQALQSFGIFIFTPLVLAFLWSDAPLQYLSLKTAPSAKLMFFTILLMISAIPVINLLGEWNSHLKLPESLSDLENLMRNMETKATEMTERMLQADSFTGLLLNLGLIAVLPAIGEELLFRGIIQNVLSRRLGAHAAVWISALIFSAIHFQFFGFLPRLLLGALLGYLLVWSGSLWLPILAHFVNNGLAVLYFYLKDKTQMPVDLDNVGKSETIIFSLISIAAVFLLILLIRRNRLIPENQA